MCAWIFLWGVGEKHRWCFWCMQVCCLLGDRIGSKIIAPKESNQQFVHEWHTCLFDTIPSLFAFRFADDSYQQKSLCHRMVQGVGLYGLVLRDHFIWDLQNRCWPPVFYGSSDPLSVAKPRSFCLWPLEAGNFWGQRSWGEDGVKGIPWV